MVTETVRGIRTDDLSYVLLVIKGAKLQEKEVELPKVQGAEGIMKQVVLEESDDKKTAKFMIRKGGQDKLHKYFLSLYANRKGFEGRPKAKEDPDLQKLQEVPQISEKSRKMAEEARKKLMGETGSNDIVTQLYEKEKVRNQAKQLRKKQFLEQQESQQQSTFKPQTNNYKSGRH